MRAYYNEIDPAAAAWLRELIKRGLIAPGDVDERSIEDVCPTDLLGYTQCHFFAGIGVWSHALRRSGWPDDRTVWTGSCPCQPFSAAGKGKGFADQRHLWPAFFHLIEVCGPVVVFGEQVAGKDGLGWLDLVQTDLEAVGYACGAVPFPAAGIGAPHIRERLYWVADRDDAELEGRGQPGCECAAEWSSGASGLAVRVDHANDKGRQYDTAFIGRHGSRDCAEGPWVELGHRRSLRGMADHQLQQRQVATPSSDAPRGWNQEPAALAGLRRNSRPGPVNGFWGGADWIGCRDGKWRPVEPGTQPLADVSAARVVRLRGYGNAIVSAQAEAFIGAYLDARAAA